ncbi:universal stress protein [Pseudonocardia sp. TRM90224]|uniref:universal stress protein n=1 Tax=Pseudonocardia sp. TRM90224 TaxID=2812678 RepID=UPI001E5BFC2B|nr:universal stress protein [Pseudonocardia sp. TRM90224]
MKYVVAYSRDSGGRSALAVARLFAGGKTSLCVCTITPATWGYPSMAAVDVEYAEFLSSHAAAALEEARAFLGEDVDAEFLARSARTPAAGALELVAELDAGLVVIGSARGGPLGRFAFGSVTSSLLHTSPVPVALAPRGYRPARQVRLQRITCGYVGPGASDSTVAAALELALRHEVPLRLVTGLVRDRQMYPSLVGYESEKLVEQQVRVDAEEALRAAVAELPQAVEPTYQLVAATHWEDALDSLHWADGEVLVVGSSRHGLGRIFMGTNASKIARCAPVPTVVVP